MELDKLKKDEIQTMTAEKAVEVETDIRREIHGLRMDIYGDRKKSVGKLRSLKKNLARVLTHRNELLLKSKA